jgi:hypothetical protein
MPLRPQRTNGVVFLSDNSVNAIDMIISKIIDCVCTLGSESLHAIVSTY